MSDLEPTPPRNLDDHRRDAATDRDLLDRVDAGDEAALERLWQRHGVTALAVARRVLGDPELADHVSRLVFQQVWRRPATFRSPRATFRHRLLEVTLGLSVGTLKCKVTQARLTTAEQRLLEAWPGHATIDAAFRAVGAYVVQRLPETQRRPVELVYLAGLSDSEVSLLLDVELDVVKRRLLLGVERLLETAAGTGQDSAGSRTGGAG